MPVSALLLMTDGVFNLEFSVDRYILSVTG